MNQTNLIFLISLPRSGSTLLQKILASHSKINSASEPWMLLPLIELDKLGFHRYYDGEHANMAIGDFINHLPEGRKDYYTELGNFIKSLYSKYLAGEQIYFLDKTPNYYRLIPEIYKIFPGAKFIFLYRNPLSVYSSIMNTWYKNKFITSEYLLRDLQYGPKFIAEGYELLKDKSIKVVYDSLVKNPAEEIKNICSYLGLEPEDSMLTNFKGFELKGSFRWDKIGNNDFDNVSTVPIDKWKSTFNSFFRKRIAVKYIQKVDDRYLLQLGKDKSHIIEELKEIPIKTVGFLHMLDYYYSSLVPKLISQRKRNLLKKKYGLYKKD